MSRFERATLWAVAVFPVELAEVVANLCCVLCSEVFICRELAQGLWIVGSGGLQVKLEA